MVKITTLAVNEMQRQDNICLLNDHDSTTQTEHTIYVLHSDRIQFNWLNGMHVTQSH